jgi:hypothetical protein
MLEDDNGGGYAASLCAQSDPPRKSSGNGSSRSVMLPSIWNLTKNSAFNLEHGDG